MGCPGCESIKVPELWTVGPEVEQGVIVQESVIGVFFLMPESFRVNEWSE